MTQKQLQIHSENILPIIKKWLYSEKDIFIRELVSNACDAIVKRKVLADHGETELPSEFRIDITTDATKGILTISDNGVGMDEVEVEKYLSQIAFSGAEEFVKSYQSNDPFIGHFGLGFYSAYMVADTVDVETLSCLPRKKPIHWKCSGSSSYELTDGEKSSIGTDITLWLTDENKEYLDDKKLIPLIKQYAGFLQYPIYCNGKRINNKEPIWISQPHTLKKEDYLAFYHELYPFEEDPLFWIHINIEYPFHVKGVLYFPRIKQDFGSNKNRVSLFSNRVFVSSDCKEILPEYLMMLKGVIDSPDIPLNVSRSYLQVDKTVRQLSSYISKKVVDALVQLHKQEPERFNEVWQDAEVVVKLGALQDNQFFEKAKEILVFKTTKGSWITLEKYLDGKEKKEIFYTDNSHANPHLLSLFEAKGIDVLVLERGALDTALISFLEQKYPGAHFSRVDATTSDHIQDLDREKTVLDSEGKTEAIKLAHFMKQALEQKDIVVEAKSLASDELPGFLLLPEDERRFRDYTTQIAGKEREPLNKATFVVNTNNPLVIKLKDLADDNQPLAYEIANFLFDITKLGQNEMESKDLSKFINKSNLLITNVINNLKNNKEKK